ncbi:MAG: aryl-sulfate sulfohydrolase [Planctomycetaceae bacterium]|nr:aryl-sulfate sulfohydrolase [Planctomycetaceae bacterium]
MLRSMCRFVVGFAAILCCSNCVFAQSQDRPNILFIFMDDLGWKDVSFMGSDFYETPNIDRLAKEGMVFTNAYSCAANCAPARACLLSGQYTPRHEVYNVGTGLRGNKKFSKLKHIPGTTTLRKDIVTWAHCLQKAGYKTATMGKWHLSKDPLPYGFDVNIGGTHSGGPPRGYFPPHGKAPGLEQAPKGEYVTDRLHDEAIKFIESNKQNPWFLYLPHFAVHTPIQAKENIIAKYKAKKPGKIHNHEVMAAMIESVDEGVGRVVTKLDELGLTDKTAVIFFSDNGGYGPATSMKPLKGYKGTYYEGGIREPFLIKWPGVVKAGTENDEPIIGVDLFPTFCAMTGAELPKDQPLDGLNLVPLFRGEAIKTRALYWHFPAYLQSYQRNNEQRDPLFRSRPCSIVRFGEWKLHEYFEDGGLELYNLKDDISEKNNLAASMPQKANELHQILKGWRERINAPVPSEPNPHYDSVAEAEAIAKSASGKGKRKPMNKKQ